MYYYYLFIIFIIYLLLLGIILIYLLCLHLSIILVLLFEADGNYLPYHNNISILRKYFPFYFYLFESFFRKVCLFCRQRLFIMLQ